MEIAYVFFHFSSCFFLSFDAVRIRFGHSRYSVIQLRQFGPQNCRRT